MIDELEVREGAMAYVAARSDAAGGMITRAELEAFSYAGEQLKLIDQSCGIRNPRQLSGPARGRQLPSASEDELLACGYEPEDFPNAWRRSAA